MNHHRPSALVLVALVAHLGCANSEHYAPTRQGAASAPTATVTSPSTVPGGPVAHHAALEVHAAFWLNVGSASDASALARRLVSFADEHGGWIQATTLGESEGTGQVTLRVPPTSLTALRALLQHSAGVDGNLREHTSSTDVTEALADLGARLRVARATETRLLALLDQRTGSLADVLAVERSLGEQRTLIEQLETTQRTAQDRVDLATVEVWLELRSGATAQPLGRQVVIAAHTGVDAARSVAVGFVLLVLEAGPTMVLLAALAFACWWLVRAIRRAQK